MIAIIASWLFFIFLFWGIGFPIAKKIFTKKFTFSEVIVTGMIVASFLAASLSFFLPLGTYGLLIFIIVAIFSIALKYNEFKKGFVEMYNKFKNKPFLLVLVIVISWISSQQPTIFDHYSYYFPTVEWFSEHGTVKGIGNLHPFLNQSSLWHVLQSVFTFPFTKLLFNDINGFLLLIGILYFDTLKEASPIKNLSYFFPIFLLFIDASSPDLPILVLTAIVFHLSLQNKQILFQVLLLSFLAFVKITCAPLILLLFFQKKFYQNFYNVWYIPLALFGVWSLKNHFISGYALFPFEFRLNTPAWTIAPENLKFFKEVTINAGYTENQVDVTDENIFKKLYYWIQLGGINAIFNTSIILLFVLIPILKLLKNHRVKLLYFVCMVWMLALLYTSPQYRFFLPIWILFLGWILNYFFQYKPILKTCFYVLLFLFTSMVCFFDVKTISTRKEMNAKLLVAPQKRFVSSKEYLVFKREELFFYSPKSFQNSFEVQSIPVPSSNKKLAKWMEKKWKLKIKMLGLNPEDGYCHEKLNNTN